MSESFLGMDITAMTTLQRNLDAQAEAIRTLARTLNSEITGAVGATWKGQDAQMFGTEWQTHMNNLNMMGQALSDAAVKVGRNIADQQSASGAL